MTSKDSDSKIALFQPPKGTSDILPRDQKYWERIRTVVRDLALLYGFGRIDTPLFENIGLFARGTGASTDIVEKEMYVLKKKGKENLVLRPEATPSVVRAYLGNGMVALPHPVKLYYIGPMFRYAQPQAGRFRQFYQFGLEIIGSKEPVLDAQIIQLVFVIFKELKIKDFDLQINSIGCPQCRPSYRETLLNYYRGRTRRLCEDCKRRLKRNPLRLLDCKQEKCKEIAKEAPQMINYLCDGCHSHFKEVLEFLDELEFSYNLDFHLVRGLDYYTKTVFEVWPREEEERSQIALGGGGRYDNLIELLGGKDTPAVGAAMGIERMISLMKSQDIKIPTKGKPRVFLAQLGDLGRKRSLKLFEEMRRAKIPVSESFSRNTIKAQLKIADKLGADFALILGQKEALDGNIILRDMKSGTQEIINLDKVVKEMKKRLRKRK